MRPGTVDAAECKGGEVERRVAFGVKEDVEKFGGRVSQNVFPPIVHADAESSAAGCVRLPEGRQKGGKLGGGKSPSGT